MNKLTYDESTFQLLGITIECKVFSRIKCEYIQAVYYTELAKDYFLNSVETKEVIERIKSEQQVIKT